MKCSMMSLLSRVVAFGAALLMAAHARAEVNLRFVCWDGDEASKVLKEEIGRFEKAHPGIKVKFEAAVYDNYFDKLLTQYAADAAPDVAMMNPDFHQRFSKRGAILPLEPFFNQAPNDVSPAFDIRGYYQNIVGACSYEGKLYVLPRDIAPMSVVYYNKDAFRKAGLKEPDGTWTWDFVPHPEKGEKDFLTVLKKLQRKDARGKVIGWGYAPGWQSLFTDMVVFGQGASYTDDPEDPKKILFDDPRVIRAYQFSADLTLKDKLMPSSFDQAGTNARQMFTQGKVAMLQNGIWETPPLRTEIPSKDKGGFEWDICLGPAYVDGTRAYPSGGSGYAIMAKTRHPKESWLLAQWMAGPPGMISMAKAGIAQPAIRSLALQEPWIPGPNTPADQQIPKNRIITDQSAPLGKFSPGGILWKEVSDIAKQPESTIYTGDVTAKAAYTKSNAVAQARLDTLRKELDLKPYDWTKGALGGILVAGLLLGWVYYPEIGKRRTLRQKKENRVAYMFLLPWLIGMVVFTAGPMILSLLMSFSDWDIIRPARFRGLGNYQEAFMVDPTFYKSLLVTCIYTVISVPAGVILSLALALLLNTKVRGMPLWRTCYYIPAMASPIAGALIWQKLFQPEGGFFNMLIFGIHGDGGIPGLRTLLGPLAGANGQINWLQNEQTALGSLILMSIFGAGGGMVILLAALQGVPQYYYEAATLDGAGPVRRFRNVTVPLISPALFFVVITGFIGSFQVFTSAFQITKGGPNNATMFFMIHLYNNAFQLLRMGYASALAWVLFFVILVFTIIQLQANRFVHYEGSER
ncbi:extracellular solute-binding protein [bacterium]|nr:MAG: extracellular solute-binding protein [bacterium]